MEAYCTIQAARKQWFYRRHSNAFQSSSNPTKPILKSCLLYGQQNPLDHIHFHSLCWLCLLFHFYYCLLFGFSIIPPSNFGQHLRLKLPRFYIVFFKLSCLIFFLSFFFCLTPPQFFNAYMLEGE